jgi:hypothetical protein
MPSAARQRLTVDLCHQGYRKNSNCSPEPVYHIQEIQASPGHCDVLQEEKHHRSKKHSIKSPRKHANSTSHGSPKSIPRRDSADILNAVQSDTERNTSGHRKVTFDLSNSAKSNSCPSLTPIVTDAYAMDSSVAPHPSEVPYPPLEWLQFSLKQSVFPIVSDTTLKAILCGHVSA